MKGGCEQEDENSSSVLCPMKTQKNSETVFYRYLKMFSYPMYVRNRQCGSLSKSLWKDAIFSSLYKAFGASHVTATTPLSGQDWGAVFGCGFSPNGSLLVAACENKCMLLYDPHNASLIQRSFLDNRIFVTCSDDTTVRLWDARNLSHELKILRGHSSWVKNIEYCSSAGKLITSGFDGNIFAWDINNYSNNDLGEQLLYINGMMRTKVCPDEKRMIISTLGGYYILIHDLDLDHFKEDMKGFRPRLYGLMQGLMQLLDAPLNHLIEYNSIFRRKRNRIEFISDFPAGDNAVSISTMQVHPQGWCIVSRNTTADEETEWTCVHDIQTLDNSLNESSKDNDLPSDRCADNSNTNQTAMENLELPVQSSNEQHCGNSSSLRESNASTHSRDSAPFAQSSPPTTNGNEFLAVLAENSTHHHRHRHRRSSLLTPLERQNAENLQDTPEDSESARENEWLRPRAASQQQRRLLFHSEEPNVGQGYIKEQSFSPDGRIIASPFANCVRLLAFNSDCHELCDAVPSKPRPLRQVALVAGNSSSVLTSTFSPVHLLYAAGAEDGSISFCSPKL
ncbi:Ddb1- and cul4-associated factor 10 homolog [Plakobranchus ocellatus]|uniref:Ddb1- and cul4-associated factor 10 homolog n=1 Tax=Plakobranchus ocellatus TaxID=259542 RepID=A0AAV3YML5_9GAST|nr:Ddb1- and cul4-associated factor 10 homolog [Plakobranchus ocellatus]